MQPDFGHRLLAGPTQQKHLPSTDSKAEYLVLSGTIKFKNTSGLLSAHLYLQIGTNTWLLILLSIMGVGWFLGIRAAGRNVVTIHHLISAVLCASWMECLLRLIYYERMNAADGDQAGL